MKAKYLRPFVSSFIFCASVHAADVTAVTNNGDWVAAATWSNNAVPSSGNAYFVPNAIGIDGYTGASNNSNVTRTFGGASLTIQNGGTLYCDSNHGTSYPDWTYTISNLTLESGANIHFRGGAGTDFFLTNGFTLASGATAYIRHSGGSYDQRVRLGAINGPAGSVIQLLATHNPSFGTYKDNYANVANSSFAGNWFLDYTVSAEEKIRLRADQANALGTGSVILERRARLEANAASSLNSLSGITLNQSTSELILNQHGWSNAAAALTINAGTVRLGNGANGAAVSAGNLSGSAGVIDTTGTGASSLTLNQITDATFGGTIAPVVGSSLAVTKSGAGRLTLANASPFSNDVPLTLANGTLAIGNGITTLATASVTSLTQSGGNLHIDLDTALSDQVAVAGDYTHTGGGIVVNVASPPVLGSPYSIVTYGGNLSANPTVTFEGLAGTRFTGSASYGDGSADAITVTFSGGSANLVWSGATDNAWDLNNTANWLNGASPDKFLTYDNVTFNDSATSGNLSPEISAALTAGTVTFHNDNNTYLLTGSGSLAGPGMLVKSNDGTAIIATNNTYSGGTDVLGGTLVVGNSGTAGTLGGGDVFVDAGATLVFNRTDTVTPAAYLLAGNGTVEQGGSGTLALTADQSFSGSFAGSAGVIQIGDGNSNTPGAAVSSASGISMKSGAVLDLPRLHSTGGETATWSLPDIALESGARLRFRASVGTTTHNLASDITTTGSSIIDNNGGGYGHNINLSGKISGSGTIDYLATSGSGSATTTRTLTLNNTATDFSGDWYVDYTGTTTDDLAALQSNAAGALGTGKVFLDDRALLNCSTANGLDSLTGVTLQKATSAAAFGTGWTNPAGALAVTDGSVTLGTAGSFAALDIASLTQDGGVIQLDLGANAASADKIRVSGNADFLGGQIAVTPTTNPAGQTYDILTYGGTLIGLPNVVPADAGRLTPVVNTGSGTNDKVTLAFTGSVASLVWKGNDGTQPNNWDDNTTQNFDNGGTPDVFRTFDNVTFDDSASSFTPAVIGTLKTGNITFGNSANAYTLSGTGAIAGTGTLVKNGTGSATISTANTFTGNVTVNAGKLLLGNAAALGNSSAGAKTVTINSGGQLDLNNQGPAARTYSYRISGNGDGSGALVNGTGGGVASNAGVLNLELLDHATIGGAARFDIGFAGGAGGTITGNGKTLTKTGTNQIMLRGDASATPIAIQVSQGILGLENSDNAFGGTTGRVTVSNGATVSSYGARTIPTPVTLNGGATLSSLGGGTPSWTGAITLAGDASVNAAATANTIYLDGVISGSGFGLTIPANGGTVNLNAANTFDGGLIVGPTAATATTVNLGGASTLAVAAGEQVVVGNTAASGTASQTLNANGAVTSAGSLRVARMGILNVNSGAVWNHGGAINVEGVGGYTATMNVNSGSAFTYTGAGTIKLNGAPANGGQGLLSIAGTFTTGAGFEQTTTPTTGYGRVTLSGSLVLSGHVPQLTTGVQFQVSGTAGAIDTNGFNTAISADITGAAAGASLAKIGAGTLTLTGTNSYTGDTWLDAGTLAGKGTPTSKVTAANGTTIAPGASIGTFACAGADLSAGATLAIEIDSTTDSADKLLSTAAVDITGAAVSFTETGSGTIPAGTKLVILDYTGSTLAGTFTGYAEGATINVGANTFTLSYADSSRVTLTSTTAGGAYDTWASSKGLDGSPGKDPAFDADPENDGIANGLEWILGGNPLAQDAASLVTASATAAGGLTLNFNREEDSIGQADLIVEIDTDLAGPWTSFATVGAASSGNVTINTAPDPDAVSVNIPAANAVAGKLFARLKATQP